MRTKISFILLFAISMLLSCTQTVEKSYNEGINIVPKPLELKKKNGHFVLDKNTTVWSSDETIQNKIADYFIDKIKMSTGYSLPQTTDEPSSNYIQLLVNPNSDIGEEGYKLNVEAKTIQIEAKSHKGLFYGIQTLTQLLPAEIESKEQVKNIAWKIPVLTIADEPRFPYRGMHLDVCRHFFPVEFIKKQLDLMALFKLNYFHWHLTEDQGWRIEIKKYPKLTEIGSKRIEGEGNEYGGFYTQEEIKEVVQYAKERFITVIPEIELPGHALAALSAYPEYSCTGGTFEVRNMWGVEADIYCAGKEKTFAFLNDIIDEVVALFPSEYFHIGGDEAPKDEWKKCKDCQRRIRREKLKDEHELQSYFVQRVEKMLLKHNKKMIGWDEILEGGLAPTATVMSWRGEDGGIEAANQGHDVIMTPTAWCYLDYYQGSSKVEPVGICCYNPLEKTYGYNPIPKKIAEDKVHHVLGTQGNIWTEYMYDESQVEYRAYPRILALAEVGWTAYKNKDYKDFERRLQNQMVRLDQYDVNYHIPLPEGPPNEVKFVDALIEGAEETEFVGKAVLAFTTTRPADMFYTLDGTNPTKASKKYTEPLHLTDGQVLKIRTILPHGKASAIRTINVSKENYIPATDVSPKNKGLMMQKAEGNFVRVADIEDVTKWEKINVPEVSKVNKLFDETISATGILEGFINVPKTAIYRFSTNVDQLYIDNKLLINNDGEVKKFSRNDAMISLVAGWHPVKIIYLDNIIGGYPVNWEGVRITYKLKADQEYQLVTDDMFMH